MKGMQKIKRGSGFRGVLDYALENGRGRVIGGNMTGRSPRELAKEFGQARVLRPDVGKPVWHNSLRLPAGERLAPEKLAQIGDEYMRRLGFSDLHQRTYVLHDDPEGQHIHIIASRISVLPGANLYLGKNENLASTRIIIELERKFNLTITRSLDYVLGAKGEYQIDSASMPGVNRKAPSRGEIGLSERTGKLPTRMQLQSLIDTATADKPTFADFVERLTGAGVSILPSGKTGAVQGISFEHEGQPFKGSDLGRSYAWKGLQARIDYDPARDQKIIDGLRLKAASVAAQEKNELLPSLNPVPYIGKHYRNTLDLAFTKEGNIYLWKNRSVPAFIDHGDKIQLKSKTDTAIKGVLQLAREKWGKNITVSGSDDYCRRAWLLGSSMGLNIAGYQPTPEDQKELERLNLEREANHEHRKPRKNSHDASGGQAAGGNSDQDANGAVHINRANGQQHGGFDRRDSRSIARHTRSGEQDRADDQGAGNSQKRDAGVEAPQAKNTDIFCSDRNGSHADRLDVVADRVSAIAAPYSRDTNNTAAGKSSNDIPGDRRAREKAVKIAAWRKQHEALGSPLYRVTLIDRDQERIKKCGYTHSVLGKSKNKHEGDHYDWKTASEIENAIDVLISKNNRGYDVYVTPVDPHFYYLLVDDLHERKKGFEGRYSAFMISGYTPVLIQESSDDNFQAIIKIPRTNSDSKSVEHETVNKLFKDIDKLYGEANIQGGVVHAFRMAGFSNRKPNKNGRFTIVKATNPGVVCEKARLQVAAMMANKDAEKEKSKAAKVKVARLEAIRSHEVDPLGRNDTLIVKACKAEFSRVIGLVEKGCIKGDLDRSTVDFWVAKALLIEGYAADPIAKAIVAVSPDISYRKPGRELEYAELTVTNAALHEDVVNALAVRHQATNHHRNLQ
jgi:hypothetical protein